MVKNLSAMWETWVWSLVRKIPWKREWQPTIVFLHGEFHDQKSSAKYNPWNPSDTTEGPTLDSLWYVHASADNSFIDLYTMTCYKYVIFSFWNSNRVINIGFINGIIKWILGLNQLHIWWARLGCSHYQVKKRHWTQIIHNMKMILSLVIWSGGKDSEIRGHSTTVAIKKVFAIVIQLLTYVRLLASP